MCDALPLLPGTLLCQGRYDVVEEINRGGSAIVYRAIDRQQQREVALKVINANNGEWNDTAAKAFQREVEYALGLLHRNIVQLLDIFTEDAHFVIVWELVDGPDLLDLLNSASSKKLSEPMTAYYFQQLLDAVIFMHDNGFCHRDLKAENCVIESATHSVKVIDFGLSKHLNSARTLGIGTPDYMAPELLLEEHAGVAARQHQPARQQQQPALPAKHTRYDPSAVDVWALGVMLYLLVTGRYPFEDRSCPGNVPATLRNIMHGKMQPLSPQVSAACADVIKQCLSRNAKSRISLNKLACHPWVTANAAVFRHQLNRNNEGVAHKRQPLPGKARRVL